MTAEAIQFNKAGELLNGQHRLQAIITAGMPITVTVATNCPDESFDRLDSGVARSASDVMHLRGHGNALTRQAVARQILMWDLTTDEMWNVAATLVTKSVITDFDLAEPDRLTTAVSIGMSAGSKLSVTASSIGAFADRVRQHSAHADRLTEFLRGYAHNIGLVDGDPRLALQRFNAAERQITHSVWRSQVSCALLARTWNYWLTGRTVTTLRSAKANILPMEALK